MKLKICLVLVLLVASAETALAQSNPVWIDNAVPNIASQVVTISGGNFGSGTPVVTLNTLQLTVMSSSQTLIVAVLPGSVIATPGTYQLVVMQATKKGQAGTYATLDVTIGAVGPQGPQGSAGSVGATSVTTRRSLAA